MRSITAAILLITCATTSGIGQSASTQQEAAGLPAVMRIKALQRQINKQQIEINALRLRLGKMQDTMKELADMIADQSSDTDDDDFTDNSDVSGFVVKSPSHEGKRSVRPIVRSAIATGRSPGVFSHRCRIH